MTPRHGVEELGRLLRDRRWCEGNERTRCLLPEGRADTALVREIDACWSECSAGKFGFVVQRQTWASLGGPPLLAGFALWGFFRTLGDVIGWRRDGRWIAWAGAVNASDGSVLDASDIPLNVPRGCLPFHDVMSSGRWRHEWQPRDCWGEHVWDRWAEVLAVFT